MPPTPDLPAGVVAVIATHRRPAELARLLASLEKSAVPLLGIVVVDNAAEAATREAAARTAPGAHYVAAGENLGCGGGLHLGAAAGLTRFGDRLTHLWILDDDAVIADETLGTLLDAMAREGADAAHPLSTDSAGRLGWFPGLLDREKYDAIRAVGIMPEQFVASCGDAPVPFSWAQGIALLVTRRAVDAVGLHRTDYWVRGEDLEFSLRITYRFRGIYVPRARVQHLPPESAGPASPEHEYVRHRAMLQNIAYTALRLRHGRRIATTIPGNWLRFLRTWGWTPRALAGAASAFFRGALLGQPAGAKR